MVDSVNGTHMVMSAIEPAPGTEASAAPSSNADVFADVAATTAADAPEQVEAAPDVAAADPVALESAPALAEAEAVATVAITAADMQAALDAQAAKLTEMFEARFAQPTPDVQPEGVAPPQVVDDDIFVAAARSQVGADAEHAPPELVTYRAEMLDKRAGWVRWSKANPSDADGQAKAQANIASLTRSLSTNLREIQGAAYRVRQDAVIAELKEQVAANRDRPAREPVARVTAKWNTGVGEHIIAYAAKLPALAKAFAAGTIDAAKITEGIDFGAADDEIAATIYARLPAWDHAAASMAQPATTPTTPPAAKPLGNPGILAPGSAPAAAGAASYPDKNADVFASIVNLRN